MQSGHPTKMTPAVWPIRGGARTPTLILFQPNDGDYMTMVLVLYYSSYGHIESMANAIAEGVRSANNEAVIKRVPELVPEDDARRAGVKVSQSAPLATIEELPSYDAIIFGTPTRFGNMAAQMRNFLDQTGAIWMKGALIGKVGSVFTSAGTQHGGHETTITSFHLTLLHHGMLIAGLPYSEPRLTDISQISGGSPYGASTIAGPDGSRTPSEGELAMARSQGAHVARIAAKLAS